MARELLTSTVLVPYCSQLSSQPKKSLQHDAPLSYPTPTCEKKHRHTSHAFTKASTTKITEKEEDDDDSYLDSPPPSPL